MAIVAGLDWATDPKTRALVRLEVPEGPGPLAVLEVLTKVHSHAVAQLCADPAHAVVGVDIPFGWPCAFARFVAGWRVAGGGAAPPEPGDFRYRLTDRRVKAELGKDPMSVSADRIAMGTRAWVALVAAGGLAPRIDVSGALCAEGPTPVVEPRIDVSGALCAEGPTLIEVYPGATVVALRPGPRGRRQEASYKKDAATRRRLLEEVCATFEVQVSPPRFEHLVSTEDHPADAFFAALTAAIYLRDVRPAPGAAPGLQGWRVRHPNGPEELEAAEEEGWIFFPVRAAGQAP